MGTMRVQCLIYALYECINIKGNGVIYFVLCGVGFFLFIDLFIDWGNPSNNLSGYINRFGETYLNWFLQLPHLIW